MMPLRSRLSTLLAVNILFVILLSLGITQPWRSYGRSHTARRHPITTGPATAVVIGSAAAATGLAFILARLSNQPWQALISMAKKVRADTLTEADVEQLEQMASRKGEVGELASVLLEMSLMSAAHQDKGSDERDALLSQPDIGTQQASELELVYYKALRKKSMWLRQQLDDKLA